MAKRKQQPLLTHTEILALAMRCLETDIQKWEFDFHYHPDYAEEMCKPAREKLKILQELYRIETGTEY